jgi:S-adenosylmethionine decarboxylase
VAAGGAEVCAGAHNDLPRSGARFVAARDEVSLLKSSAAATISPRSAYACCRLCYHLLVGEDAMSRDALFQLGIASQKEDRNRSDAVEAIRTQNDHFVEKNGVTCAGAHLIIDLYGAERLDDIDHIAQTLRRCVNAGGATLLHIHLHPFEPNGGVSGVAVLAESHISIHSWPERDYAALDVFMCGETTPHRCIDVLRQAFRPDRVAVKELLRGKDA